MSDVKTFTVRQLDRETAKVMEACDTYGSVRIKRRDGRTYTLEAEKKKTLMGSLPDFAARRRKIFGRKVISEKQAALADKLLAGE